MAGLASMFSLFTMAVALLLSGVSADGCECVTIWKQRKSGKGTRKTITKCGDPDHVYYKREKRSGRAGRKGRYKCCIEGVGLLESLKSCYRESKGRSCGGDTAPGRVVGTPSRFGGVIGSGTTCTTA